jgi:N-acetylneuraminic acid mutarotase
MKPLLFAACLVLLSSGVFIACKKDNTCNNCPPDMPGTPATAPPCVNISRPVINARLTPVGTLSKGRIQIAVASAGTKIFFAGGRWTLDCPDCWGSSRVDIYDTVTHQWSTAELSKGRWGIATAALGNKILFAGGESGDGAFNEVYASVDIYDAGTNTWSVASLSESRSYIAAAAVGSKVFFAGGWQEDHRVLPPTGKVDIFDVATNTWSVAALSEPRGYTSAVAVGQKVYFAGGLKDDNSQSKRIDIYDNVTGSWSAATLNTPMGLVTGIASGDRIYWGAGCAVEVKNVTTANSSNAFLFSSGSWLTGDGQNAVLKDNKIIFFRHTSPTDKFDIYDIATNTWSIGMLPQFSLEHTSIISVNNTIYLTGGMLADSPYSRNDKVWKLEF